jgi:hypothetical protein
MVGIYRVAAQLVASREVLSSTELVSQLVNVVVLSAVVHIRPCESKKSNALPVRDLGELCFL